MANDVFANGREISCKSGSGKSICAFPDVCFTPPTAPPTPPGVPIPYPNTGMASDTTSGSKKVKISNKEVMLKNKSYFKKGAGNEAGSAPKKGIVTSSHHPPGAPSGGKAYFNAWSMDVKIEGENVVRHLDLTTHNHASIPGNSLTWPYIDTQALAPGDPCADEVEAENDACDETKTPPGSQPITVQGKPKGVKCTQACADARACALPKFKDTDKVCCMPPEGAGRTGDHLMEVNCFTQEGGRSGHGLPSDAVLASLASSQGVTVELAGAKTRPLRLSGFDEYDEMEAPTACAEWPDSPGTGHYRMQASRDAAKRRYMRMRAGDPLWVWGTGEESYWTYDEALDAAVNSHHEQHPQCDPKCTRAQLDAHHRQFQDSDGPQTPLRTQIVKGGS